MDILIPDSWLREFLKTKATPKKIAQYLTLCGSSVGRVEKTGYDSVYLIEITTNRVDSASVYGIAREAQAILPRFGINAELVPPKIKFQKEFSPKVDYLDARVDPVLCPRFTAVLIKDIKIAPSPEFMQRRLKLMGIRPINNVVDISNYLMAELGQPTHTFDYEKIRGAKMVLRAAKRGERITTLDGKTHTLAGGDIVIEDGRERLIDLAGIMGGENSAVSDNTKNVLLFVQTYNPINIRKTSMSLSQRTAASALFEKGPDPENVAPSIRRGIDLFQKLCGGQPESEVLDIYPLTYKPKVIATTLDFINKRLGIEVSKKEISQILLPLGLKTEWRGNQLKVWVPSWRAADITIPEDIVEEVARILGYHNLPSELMTGKIPDPPIDTPFEFEFRVKQILKGFGGVEVYTLSLVAKNKIGLTNSSLALKLKNPLGRETEFLRTSLAPSLIDAAYQNATLAPFHLFEMANVYLPVRGKLPQEPMMLGGMFAGFNWRDAKGIIEGLLEELGVVAHFKPQDGIGFLPNHRLSIERGGKILGQFGVPREGDLIYYDFDLERLRKASRQFVAFKPIPKYPAQVEDISIVLPPRVLLGEVIENIKQQDKQIITVSLVDVYDETRTVRVTYQNPRKTLTDKEVEKIRGKIIRMLQTKFGARIK